MTILVSTLTLGGFEALPAHDRQCVFWTVDPTVEAPSFVDTEFEKEAWLSMVMLEWGPCGQVATTMPDVPDVPDIDHVSTSSHADEEPDAIESVGCALYAPPGAVPRVPSFPTAPVSPDAILLTSLYSPNLVDDGDDVRAVLMQAAVRNLVNRGVRALEAFGVRLTEPEAETRYLGVGPRECGEANCMIDAEFLEKYGFEVVAPHHRFPRLRLELDRDHGWKEDVESALDRLLEAAALTVVEADPRVAVGAR